MWYDFRWIDWNLSKIESHAVSTDECEWVVRRNVPRLSGEKFTATGRTKSGRQIKVVYLKEDSFTVFVITAFDF